VERVVLRAGEELVRTIDLGERAPRAIAVELREGGAPLALGAIEARWTSGGVEQVAQAGWDGKLRFGPLFPGEWALAVEGVRPEWRKELGRTLVVGPGLEPTLVIDVAEAVGGALRFADERGGGALSEQRIELSLRQGIGNRSLFLDTDVFGRVELTQPPGELLLRRARDFTPKESREAPWTRVAWPPADGSEPVVQLP
jgi:hypothetical protein